MPRLPLSFASLFCLTALTGGLIGQTQLTPLAPTSVPLEKTFTPVFGPATGPCDLQSQEAYSNFRLILNYDATTTSNPRVILLDREFPLPTGSDRTAEIAFEHLESKPARVRVWDDSLLPPRTIDIPGSLVTGPGGNTPVHESQKNLRFDRDFTAMVRFKTRGDGTLIANAMPKGEWVPDAKALYVRGGHLVYDIGWLGAMRGSTKVNDGKDHVAVLVVENGRARIILDGKQEAEKKNFTRPDAKTFVFKLGSAATDFGGDFAGVLQNVRFWKRALGKAELAQLANGRETEVNTPDFHWLPTTVEAAPAMTTFGVVPGYAGRIRLVAGEGFQLHRARVQALAAADHGNLLRHWDADSVKRGKEIYHMLCVTCHGTLEKPGSLPTAPRFHEAQFHNGADPYRMFQTLDKGYGLMVPQPQYTTSQKYDVIHYLREEFLKEHNPQRFVAPDEDYIRQLPRDLSLQPEEKKSRKVPQYLLQDFGNSLLWTLQVEPGNIAQKGIAIRLDDGPGGITKGKAWALYDHDTMRLAAIWTGEQFVDWRGIAFDGSHGTHTSIVGEKHFVFPNEPAWGNPATGKFEDTRILGRDGRPYGPLPGDWVKFRGLDIAGQDAVIRYTVGDCEIRETISRNPGDGSFHRTLHGARSSTDLVLRLDRATTHRIPAQPTPFRIRLAYHKDFDKVHVIEGSEISPLPDTHVSKRFAGTVTTEIIPGKDDGAYAIDVLTHPDPNRNPWQSWMRTTGFDFLADGKSAVVSTWNGDVWIVDGIDQREGELQWQRICSGLFQPLGVKIRDGEIFVICRDMIAKLVDLNGDRETDTIECFNNDHQVTEHFHEFAMGLQADAEGNFYYAKSARHALKAVVPHHGTVLRVSKDGSRTDILATGFRAANGICLNPDGSFIVTDQEGHWNPKNRINWVKGLGADDFYGNMYGYHNVTDESDEAMNPPLCWITNRFDRSPAELLWVPENSAWKSLRGSLLNLSYGYGQIFVVPHENVDGQVQGGMCPLPFERFPTGIMRGRFHPIDGQLYSCGMYAWAGNQKQPGGFYRIRATGKPGHVPIGLTTAKGTVTITFTDPLDRESAETPTAWTIEAWDLKRTKNYGSKHYNQRPWKVTKASLTEDGKSVTLTVPDLAPTWGMSIRCKIHGSEGEGVQREIHNSIYKLKD